MEACQNSNNTYAIQDRDISTVYIYLCDYYEYMDELKGYYWSDDYEEKAKTNLLTKQKYSFVQQWEACQL